MTASRHRSNPRSRGAAALVVIAAAVGGLAYLGVRTDGLDWLWGAAAGAGMLWAVSRVPGGKASDTAGSQETSCVGVSMREIAESCFGIEALLDARGRLCWISPSIERVTGFNAAECTAAADPIELLVHDADRAFGRAECAKALNGTSGSFEIRLAHRAVGVVWVACNWRTVRDRSGRVMAVRLSAEDIQMRKQTELKQLESLADARRARALSEHYLARTKDERQRLAALLNTVRLGIVLFDTGRRVEYFNQSFLALWGFENSENLFGMRDVVLFGHCERLLADVAAYRRHVTELLAGEAAETQFEFALKDGRVMTETTAIITRENGAGEIGRVWIIEDVTAVRKSAEVLMSLAERDALTGLFNRRRFDEDLDRTLGEAVRRGRRCGLLVLDLDGFKPINDVHGHQAGDEVLVRLAERVGQVVRRHEMLFRLGGDEFAILVSDSEPSSLDELARRVVSTVAEARFEFAGHSVSVTVSVGYASFPEHANDATSLVAAADEAMYCAKAAGRNRWVAYSSEKS